MDKMTIARSEKPVWRHAGSSATGLWLSGPMVAYVKAAPGLESDGGCVFSGKWSVRKDCRLSGNRWNWRRCEAPLNRMLRAGTWFFPTRAVAAGRRVRWQNAWRV